jgi:glycosyltransferase involved in cell wall biosynthesis
MPTEKKLRIIHTEASPHWGGQEIRIFEEMKWFREQGHEMILVAPDNGTLYQRCKDAGFEVISVYFTKPRTFLNILKMLWIIWRKKPDVVATHSSTDSWAGLLAAFLLKIRKRIRYRHVSAPVKRKILNKMQYKIFANGIITTAECIKRQINQDLGVRNDRLHNIFTGISVKDNLPDRKSTRALVCKKHNIHDSDFIIGIISVIRGWKGHRYIVQAFEQISSVLPSTLLIVGGGPGYNSLAKYLKTSTLNSKKIIMVGHQDNTMEYYRTLDVCALASYKNEGVPQCGLRSMFAETPFIGSNIGGIPEIILTNENGINFESKDVTGIVSAIRKLQASEEIRKKVIQNAKSWVLKNATSDIQYNKCLKVFSR